MASKTISIEQLAEAKQRVNAKQRSVAEMLAAARI